MDENELLQTEPTPETVPVAVESSSNVFMPEDYYIQVLDYLRVISENVQVVRENQEAQMTAYQEYKESKSVAESEQADAYAERESIAESVAIERFDSVKENLQNMDTSLSSLDFTVYESDFEALQNYTSDMGTTAQQTNSFLVVIGFGVFLLVGLLLSRIVWRKL